MQKRCTRRPPRPGRRGFTLVEVIISVALGALVMGGAMALYSFGNRSFYKTTEHSSFRSEAMLMIERVGQDLDQLVVSPKEDNPVNGELSILNPFVLGPSVSYTIEDPNDATKEITVPASHSVTFFRYHHLAMDTSDPDGPPQGLPTIVARKVEYVTEEMPDGTVNLLRNGQRINRQPLDRVIFHKEPPIVTAHQVKGSPHAILTVKVVPKGGMSGHFGTTKKEISDKILQVMREKSSLVEKTFHLVGYESLYTNVLYRGLQKIRAHLGNNDLDYSWSSVLAHYQAALAGDPILLAVFDDAYAGDANSAAPPQLLERLTSGMGGRASQAFRFPSQVFLLEDKPFEVDQEAFTDATWLNAGSPVAGPTPETDESQVGGQGAGQGTQGSGSSGSGSSRSGSGSARSGSGSAR